MAAAKEKAHVSKEKLATVKNLVDGIKKNNTMMIVSIKSLPSQQFQKIKKDLRSKAKIMVAKKNMVLRAIEESGVKELEPLKASIKEDSAILFSNDDAFELAAYMTENRNPVPAKEGQEAEDDISVSEGPTELVPGPVISELGALGLQVMVEEGKITIRKAKVVVKKGEKVNATAVSILQKLGIKPFMVGITPVAAYDAKDKKVYSNIRINKTEIRGNFVLGYAKALGFARNLGYVCKETIGSLLGKAERQALALNKLSNKTQ